MSEMSERLRSCIEMLDTPHNAGPVMNGILKRFGEAADEIDRLNRELTAETELRQTFERAAAQMEKEIEQLTAKHAKYEVAEAEIKKAIATAKEQGARDFFKMAIADGIALTIISDILSQTKAQATVAPEGSQ